MACKWNGLFNVGEDFDDEDLLQADWDVPTEPVATAAVPFTAPSCRLRTPIGTMAQTAVHRPPSPPRLHGTASLRPLEKAPGSGCVTPGAAGNTAAFKLRCISTSAVSTVSSCPPHPPVSTETRSVSVGAGLPTSAGPAPSNASNSNGNQPPDPFPDDFDDWDVDLEELDENVPQQGTKAEVPQGAPVRTGVDSLTPAKKMRVSDRVSHTQPGACLQGPNNTDQMACQPVSALRLRHPSTTPGPSPCPSPATPSVRPQIPAFSRGVPSPAHASPVTPRWQTPVSKSFPSGRSSSTPFSPLSPVPTVKASGSLSGGMAPPTVTPHSLHTPVLTNHLVQLVSASSKTPQRPRCERARPKTRRFPGPAGALPQQPIGRSMDDVVVSLPQTPAHGAVARLRSQLPSSQVAEEEEFSGGPWATMKAEMGLDERNPACFLHSYSVVMVLRKAALRQLAKNKVPNMAVMVKTLQHTHADAKALFRDPTGEMQGTVHRRLLEDRQGELKAGAVLLLKQVGVFSPSHRNHYLNVTPNNLLRIYPPDGAAQSSTQLSHHEELEPQSEWSSHTPGGPVSQMDLLYDDDECSDSNVATDEPVVPPSSTLALGPQSGKTPQGPEGGRRVEDSSWEADDLDALLGELPEESYIM